MSTESIRSYWEKVDSELLDALDDFTQGQNPIDTPNITVIYPDSNTRNNLLTKIRNGDPADESEIIKTIKAMFIQRSIPKYDNFNGGSAVTFAGILFPVESGTFMGRMGVTQPRLTNGALLGYDANFQNDSNRSLYRIVKGTLPTDGQKVQESVLVKGSMEGSVEYRTMPKRLQYAYHLRTKYTNFCYKYAGGEKEAINPYLRCVLSLMAHLKKKYSADGANTDNLYWLALSLLDHSPITSFWLLFEPFKTKNYIIPDVDINEFQIVDILFPPVELYESLLAEYAARFNDSSAISSLVQFKQTTFPASRQYMRDEAMSELRKVSQDLVTPSSQVSTLLSRLLPESTKRLYTDNPHMKYWQDFFRLYCYIMYESLNGVPSWKSAAATYEQIDNHMVKLVDCIRLNYPGNSYVDEVPAPSKYRNISNDKLNNLLGNIFAPSALFLYVPSVSDDFTKKMDAKYKKESMCMAKDGTTKIGYDKLQALKLSVMNNSVFLNVFKKEADDQTDYNRVLSALAAALA